MRRLTWLVLLAVAPFLVGGCAAMAVAPVAAIAYKGATKAHDASRPITDSEEYYIGRAVAARVLTKYKLDQNPNLTEYVNEVGDTVARKSSRPNPFRGYHFAVLDTGEINAFACPGGIIFVTRGLIQTCKSEDQLAAVLAHEVAHVANKDGINSISKARWTEVWTAMGKEAVTVYGGSVAAGLVTLFEGSIDDVFKT
ncbi:MAG: M48 family metalloprotease, partial [Desulfobaccales bacterium]